MARLMSRILLHLRNSETIRHPRGFAVGRKNHYGSRPERGTRVAALFYSLIESAKLCGVEPRAFLREATLRAARNSGVATLTRDFHPGVATRNILGSRWVRFAERLG
jgi:transposase